ncbi:MAG: shikimate dehydrogenase [Bacteroidetes bacterium]|nr:shikimate dehydrogenase [Bacteroidota bacterium]
MQHRDLPRVTGHTRPIAILGYPIHHSLSPWIHNAAFAAAGLDYVYLALDVKPGDIETAVRGLRVLDFAGITLTSPHKQTVIPLLDELTEEARAIGAVNTVVNRDGRWIGTNTDATGFRRMLELNGLYRPGMKAVMLGAGGAARAGLYALLQVAREVVVLNRTVSRGEELLRSMEAFHGQCRCQALTLTPETLETHLRDADLLVNTTSVGMSPNDQECPVPEEVEIPAGCGVADMIYSPPKTLLLQRAERAGAVAASGHLMLLHQAVDAFKFWTGVDPDFSVMDDALRRGREAQMRERH